MIKKLFLYLFVAVSMLYATVPARENVTKLYVATFERAPDAAGLSFWVDQSKFDLEKIAASFFDQEETQEKYPPGTPIEDFIETVYANLFNRKPDEAGAAYWYTALKEGSVSRSVFILTVINGAQGDDATILENKTTVGLAYADAQCSDEDLAKKVLADITASSQSMEAALSLIKEECGDSGKSYFPKGAIWYQDISKAPADPESAAIIRGLNNLGGWGNGNIFQIDFSLKILDLEKSIEPRSFIATEDFYEPDCDYVPVPVPPGGSIEGNPSYECADDGDCHLIVADWKNGKLYEMWRANITPSEFYGGCLAVWDMNRVYPPSGRGEQCTSADAAGYPIAPLLFNADEVAAGHIDHALRFILPNPRIQNGVYVHPATHSTGATGGDSDTPPYGARFRLKADFDMSRLPSEAARTVAKALQQYGMFLADGGDIAMTAESDRYTTAKWEGLLGSRDLQAIEVTDFEMIEAGERIPYTGNCQR